MIVLAAESTAGPNLGGFLVVVIIVGLFWLIHDFSKKARARSEHLRARRSLTSSQRRAVARIDRSAKASHGSTKGLWDQFGAFKGNPKAFGKEAAALHKTYKDSKKK